MTIGILQHARPSDHDWFWNPLVRVLIIVLVILALALLFIGGLGVRE